MTDANRRRPSAPLDAERQAMALAVWDQYGGRLRRAVVGTWPGLGRQANQVLGPDGFEAACLRGLVVAASKFDPERGTKLITYALPYMRNETQQDLAAAQGQNSRGNSLGVIDVVVESESGEVTPLYEMAAVAPMDNRPEMSELRAAVRRQVGDLEPRLRMVVMGRFFFGLNLRELSVRLGCSRERVRQLELLALDHLRRKLGEGNA